MGRIKYSATPAEIVGGVLPYTQMVTCLIFFQHSLEAEKLIGRSSAV